MENPFVYFYFGSMELALMNSYSILFSSYVFTKRTFESYGTYAYGS